MEWIAHRGASFMCPENTRSAFKRAIDMGADQLECDIQRTKDGKFIIFHDFTLERTTNGKGRVKDHTWKDLEKLSAHNKMEDYFGEKILSLEAFLEMVPRGMMLNIEIKREQDEQAWERELFLYLSEKLDVDDFILSSLNHKVLENIAKESDKVKLGMALEGELIDLEDYLKSLPFRIYSYHPATEYVSVGGVERLHSLGIKVYPWIVDDKNTLEKMLRCGVDGVMTNRLGTIQ